MKYDVVVVAAGKGKRADLGFNKILFKMKNGKSVIENTLDIFLNDEDCIKIILVTNEETVFDNNKLVVTKGGEERIDSVERGLKLVESEYVLIHDGARPFLNKEALIEVKEKLKEKDAVVLGRQAQDTIKVVNGDKILSTLDRNHIFMAETPQGFKTALIKECYANRGDVKFTDDASLLEALGKEVFVVYDKYDNKKLTNKIDFENI